MGIAYVVEVEGVYGSQVKVEGKLFDNSKRFLEKGIAVYIKGGSFVPSDWNFYKIAASGLLEEDLVIKDGSLMYLVPEKGLLFTVDECLVNPKSPIGTDVSTWLGVK